LITEGTANIGCQIPFGIIELKIGKMSTRVTFSPPLKSGWIGKGTLGVHEPSEAYRDSNE
jgi:hypothetical protein